MQNYYQCSQIQFYDLHSVLAFDSLANNQTIKLTDSQNPGLHFITSLS